jgi:hypothetical protein
MNMNIKSELAKRIWEDDEEMLERLEHWEEVLCLAEIDDDFVMTLTPIRFQAVSGDGVASESKLDYSPTGNSAKVQLFAGSCTGQIAGEC